MERPNLPIGREEAAAALQTLKRYKAGKATLERRIVENECWWRLRHWGQASAPASAWLQNCIANKHADAMDSFPSPTVLPREQSDAPAAGQLSGILPVVLEQNDYAQVYSDVWWYKLKTGTGVTGVFWNPEKNNGLGDVDIRQLDLLNLFWEPGVKDIQASANLFSIELVDNALLRARYPGLRVGGGGVDVTQYVYDDAVDVSDKTPVVDWYYKQRRGTRTVVQYAKLAGGTVLYATENDPAMRERGFYDHGLYPFIFDILFPEEGSPAGYGYIDVCKAPQGQVDQLNEAILKNALMAARPRWFVRGDGGINEEEYADWSRDFVHYQGSGSPRENLSQVEVRTLPDVYVAILNNKIAELKETSGNRDFNQGGVTSGVTAASAIAALQEAGGKLSRDMVQAGYRAYGRMCNMVIELIRQFYDIPRCFRITGPQGENAYTAYTNAAIRPIVSAIGGLLTQRKPIFDVRVRPAAAGAYSRISQNELAMQLYKIGFFDPQQAPQALKALEMMDFDQRERVIRSVALGLYPSAGGDPSAGPYAGSDVGGGTVGGRVEAGDGVRVGAVEEGMDARDGVRAGTVEEGMDARDGVRAGTVEEGANAGSGAETARLAKGPQADVRRAAQSKTVAKAREKTEEAKR